jgi:hypothetical protein
MSTLTKNLNYFIPTGFNFIIDRIPNVNFFCQSVNLPGLSLGVATVNTPFRDYPVAGDKVDYNEFRISFVVDEELKNWLEIYNWIIGLGYPSSTNQYKDLKESHPNGVYSEGILFILSSHKNVQYKVVFNKIFPISLSDIDMNSISTDTTPTVADVSFAYTIYNIERIISDV